MPGARLLSTVDWHNEHSIPTVVNTPFDRNAFPRGAVVDLLVLYFA